MYKGPTDKVNQWLDWGWVVGAGGGGKNGGCKMKTTVLSNNKIMKIKIKNIKSYLVMNLKLYRI